MKNKSIIEPIHKIAKNIDKCIDPVELQQLETDLDKEITRIMTENRNEINLNKFNAIIDPKRKKFAIKILVAILADPGQAYDFARFISKHKKLNPNQIKTLNQKCSIKDIEKVSDAVLEDIKKYLSSL